MPRDDLASLQRGLRRCLDALGLSVAEAEASSGLAEGYLKDILSGKSKAPGILLLRRFTNHFNLALDQLFDSENLNTIQPRIPLRFCVASAFSEERPAALEIDDPAMFFPAPARLAPGGDYFAAEIVDESADDLYPPGSIILCRPIAAAGTVLKFGKLVLVRVRAADSNTMEILVGVLDQTSSGDIILTTRSSMRELPRAVEIRRGPVASSRFAASPAHFGPAARELDYRPDPGDRAEIIGQVVVGITLEEAA